MSKIKVFVFANIPVEGEKRSIGGATVLAKKIIDFLEQEESVEIYQQQIRNLWQPKWQLFDFLFWVLRFPFAIRRMDVVSIHATKDMHFYFAPILCIWCKLLKKRYIYHCFAGNFHVQYESKKKWHKKILNYTVLDANYLLLETKEMVSYFTKIGRARCIWMPNSRMPVETIPAKKSFKRRYVFISRILPCKGVGEIFKVFEGNSDIGSVDFFGPINDAYYKESDFINSNIHYRGTLSPNEVINTMKEYDVLILPTYCYGEGYPGAIIEAFSIGMPVIATEFNAIPELIESGYNGFLVPPRDIAKLKEVIEKLEDPTFQKLRKNALKSFENFNSVNVFSKFVQAYKNEL